MVEVTQSRLMRGQGVLPRKRIEAGLLAVAFAALAAGVFVSQPRWQLALLAIGSSVMCGLAVIRAGDLVRRIGRRSQRVALDRVVTAETIPSFLTDGDGMVLTGNSEAATRLAVQAGAPVWPALEGFFAAPAVTGAKLLRAASQEGAARADRAAIQGTVRVSVTFACKGLFLWRVEALTPDDASPCATEISLPMLIVAPDGRVIGANSAFVGEVDRVPRSLSDLSPGRGEPASGGVVSLPTAEGPVTRQVCTTHDAATGNREVYFLPPDPSGAAGASHIFDTLPVPMLKLRADATVSAANTGACELLGRAVPRGTPLAALLSGLGRPLTDWLQDVASRRGTGRAEFLQVRGREGDRFVQVSLKPVKREADGTAVVAVLTDATELKTLEAQFVQSQKMQAIGQLAGGVAHDFNNLLTAISGHCDLLLLRHDEGDAAYADLIQIYQNANRAAGLVGQLLAFSRKQTLSPEVVDLREVLADLTHLLGRLVGEPVKLFFSHDEALPPIRVDKRQLEQVIMNLVVNARDAMPDGGEIALETVAVTIDTELRRNRAVIPPGDYATIRVRDQGIGIAPENLQKIFEPFYTTKKTGEGTGLGLSTAYGIVKQTGGFIFADSTPGKGTVFTLYFPAHLHAAEIHAPAGAKRPASEPANTDAVILLVEDEAPVRAFASRALRLQGYTVIEAEDAEQALSILDDAAMAVDVFVSDVVMPGMDGPTWVSEALKTRPDTRVIFMSGYAEDALSDHQRRIPQSVFLPKPFSLQDLTSTVHAQLS